MLRNGGALSQALCWVLDVGGTEINQTWSHSGSMLGLGEACEQWQEGYQQETQGLWGQERQPGGGVDGQRG